MSQKYTIEPNSLLKGYNIINPQAITSKFTPGYVKTTCNGKPSFGCRNDGRLYDAGRNMWVTLDTVPISVPSEEAAEARQNITNYGKHYNSYQDINAGQITYYIDKSISDPYFNPVFYNKAGVQKMCYVDPMDRISMMYPRTPISSVICKTNDECLSSMTDLSEFREELMAIQMRAQNRQRYELNFL